MRKTRARALVITVKSSKLATMKRLLPVLLLAASSAVLAESGAYRVEVIVFRNLNVTAEPAALSELRSFSMFPDPRQSPPAKAEAEAVAADAGPDGYPQAALPANLPDDLRVPGEKSDAMDNAWRRLRSSQTYQPLVYAAWEQNRIDYYPPMRIHDEQVIDIQLRPLTRIVVADLAAPDPLAAYRSTFYQLDGSLQLRRSRFLHLSLDLEYREKNPQDVMNEALPAGQVFGTAPAVAADTAGAYRSYALLQNRQVNTGEMQYFDTPFLGALVFVTAIQ